MLWMLIFRGTYPDPCILILRQIYGCVFGDDPHSILLIYGHVGGEKKKQQTSILHEWLKSMMPRHGVWAIYNDRLQPERSPQMVVKSKGPVSPKMALN